MKVISKAAVDTLFSKVRETHEFFSGRVIEKTSGEIRDFVAQFKPPKEGAKPRYNPKDYNLVCVWDVQKSSYISLWLDGLLFLTIGGTTYEILENRGKAYGDRKFRNFIRS